MTDVRLRELERVARETGEPADQARVLVARIRAEPEFLRMVEYAAIAGDQASRLATPTCDCGQGTGNEANHPSHNPRAADEALFHWYASRIMLYCPIPMRVAFAWGCAEAALRHAYDQAHHESCEWRSKPLDQQWVGIRTTCRGCKRILPRQIRRSERILDLVASWMDHQNTGPGGLEAVQELWRRLYAGHADHRLDAGQPHAWVPCPPVNAHGVHEGLTDACVAAREFVGVVTLTGDPVRDSGNRRVIEWALR